jgi:hypothetical protein
MAQKKMVDITNVDEVSGLTLNELYELLTKVNTERGRLKDGAKIITQAIDNRIAELDAEHPVGEVIAPEGIESDESVHEG